MPRSSWTNGNLYVLVKDLRHHQCEFEPELKNTPPLCLPEISREDIQRMLGFFIGEPGPSCRIPYDAPRGMLVLPAPRPP
jgi:hypothetical protein